MYIFITADNKYVGMDNDSGGYPYITDNCLSVHPWSSISEAKKYQESFDGSWILMELHGLSFTEI